MRHRHGILCGIPISQADTTTHFDEGGEAGKHDVDFTLIEIPDVELGIHALVRRLHLQTGELPLPECSQPFEVLIDSGRAVLRTHALPVFCTPLAQKEDQPCLLARSKGQGLFQRAAVISPQLCASAHPSGLHRDRIALGPVRSDKSVPKPVESVRDKAPREELKAVLFVMQLMLDDAVLIPAPRRIEAHLKVPIVHIHLMKAELQIGKHRKPSLPTAVVAKAQVPDLHRIVHRDKQSLLRRNAAVVAEILHITETVATGEVLLRLSDRLPGDGPEISVPVVPQIEVMPLSVHGYAVWPKAGDPVVLGAAADQITPCRVIEDPHHFIGSDVVGPGDRQIDPVDDIFPCCVIKMPVLHRFSPQTLCYFRSVFVVFIIPDPC